MCPLRPLLFGTMGGLYSQVTLKLDVIAILIHFPCFRVAVLLQPESAFCVDSKQLKGFELIKKRHLEIMGYKIVEVSNLVI